MTIPKRDKGIWFVIRKFLTEKTLELMPFYPSTASKYGIAAFILCVVTSMIIHHARDEPII